MYIIFKKSKLFFLFDDYYNLLIFTSYEDAKEYVDSELDGNYNEYIISLSFIDFYRFIY